ncbi:MAG: hypothetical protein UT37_C0005G0011 [Parcubacteria group bacterium GW2011_GWA2_39_18]|nr:MAG: hypothetical protein UT37_C0005G0011 [Parcubacteria group bacterium GW2011_GWA2_39_18]
MFERFTESKPIESKEATIKNLAREMLERFRARFKKGEKTEHIEEPVSLSEPVITEDVEVTAEEEKPEVVPEPQETEKSESTELLEPKTVEKAKPIKKERERKTDRGTFESVATNNYFEGWDEDIELKGNPEIKEQIRQNIIQAEKANRERYEYAAADLGVSVEEFKARLQAKIEDMVKRSNFFRATQFEILEKIMNVDGRWKSQFETGTSQGTPNPGFRAASEMRMFGFNKISDFNMPITTYGAEIPEAVLQNNKERRPIYGYFSDEEHGAINSYGKIPPPTNVSSYGTINFKIKKEKALKKATLTFHDSLSPSNGWPPTPAAKPHFTSFRLSYFGGKILNELKSSSVTNWNENYTEVQYHDGLTMDDVESIHVSTHNGVYPEEIKEIRRIFKEYKEQHPESTIQLIEF